MDSFDPFRHGITSSELGSFMHQKFPLVSFDRDISTSELQALAKKWIDFASRASAHIATAPSVSDSKPKTSSKKRPKNKTPIVASRSEIHRGSGSNKRCRKGLEAQDTTSTKATKKSASSKTRNNPSRVSKSDANTKTAIMYDLSGDPTTRRRSKQSTTSLNDVKTKSTGASSRLQKLKIAPIDNDDSSSLSALSDDDDKCAPLSVSGELEGLNFEPCTAAVTTIPEPTSWDAEETLIEGLSNDTRDIEAEIEKDLIDLGQVDVFQLPNVGDVKCESVDLYHTSPSNVNHTCKVSCCREIRDLRARVERLEDFVLTEYRVPPPAVVAVLEELNRL
ncbi:hypothetical protein DFH28DRAFT_926455 [Melampsora americana]|nr:hypothetical protein DFH28DRAFT_1126417 [Melampsora americana]KAH9815126.1 hypothetical protein DFH28DRAFT_1126498 [Melampsora americana]KAH9817603.1 hypothetical protein DFH28DRAFT_926455 [Melampsora americana]